MKHPQERELALYAGSDCSLWDRLILRRHVAYCAECGARVAALREDRAMLARLASELPAGLDWDRLAGEMTANIRVGLEAGECVGEVKRAAAPARPLGWLPVLVGAGMSALVLGGFYLNFPVEQRASLVAHVSRLWTRPAPDEGVAAEAARASGAVSKDGPALTFLNPGKEQPVVVVSTRGALRSSWVDEDTGQVTITNVYAQ